MTMPALRGVATRRDVIKSALKTGAYAAPVIAAGVIPMAVGAVTPAPTMTPAPTAVPTTGPVVFVAPASGSAGTVFAVTGSRFPANTALEVRLLTGPVGAVIGAIFSLGSSSATGTFFTTFTANTRVGTFTYGVEPVRTTNVLAQFALVNTTDALPTVPILSANPVSGPVGTDFAFNASGLTPLGLYNLRAISAPAGDSINGMVVRVTASASGQIAFGLDTSMNGFVGTYVIGIANASNTTILAQATVITTGIAGQAAPRTGDASAIITTGPGFMIDG